MKKLTKRIYWDERWKDMELPRYRDMKTYSMQLIDKLLKKHVKSGENNKFIEIGCAPGSWMIYFYRNFGFKVYGMDYLKPGIELTKQNLRLANVEAKLYWGDIFKNNLKKNYFDIVFSWGLIEHFDNQQLILRKHYELLKDGGQLIVFVPNCQGLNNVIQFMFNRKILRAHHKITKEEMQNLFENLKMKDVKTGYIGYFSPSRYDPGNVFGMSKYKFKKLHDAVGGIANPILRRLPYFESKYFSAFVYGIASK